MWKSYSRAKRTNQNREPMRIYFDTNIADFAYTAMCWEQDKNDIKFSESQKIDMFKNVVALRYLLDLDKEWNLIFGTSKLMKKEVDKIRIEKNFDYYAQKLPSLKRFYNALEQLSSRRFEEDKAKNKLCKGKKERLRKKLTRIVVDEHDVEHIIEFAESGWDAFLTLDNKHILKKKKDLKKIGLKVCSPLEFLKSFLGVNTEEEALKLLKTALHGSWARHFIIEKPK